MIPIERPNGVRADEMTASGMGDPGAAWHRARNSTKTAAPHRAKCLTDAALISSSTERLLFQPERSRLPVRVFAGRARDSQSELTNHSNKIYARAAALQACLSADVSQTAQSIADDRSHRQRSSPQSRKARDVGRRPVTGPASKPGYRSLPGPEASVRCPAGGLR